MCLGWENEDEKSVNSNRIGMCDCDQKLRTAWESISGLEFRNFWSNDKGLHQHLMIATFDLL
jgi:hypothetical protein